MNSNKIAMRLAMELAPVCQVERLIDGTGVPLSENELKEVWGNVLDYLGYEDVGEWMDIIGFKDAVDRNGQELSGIEKWLCDEVMELADDALASGYHEMSGLGISYVTKKIACDSCPPMKRVGGLNILARIVPVLKSRRMR
jgi:hypothetical protein